MTDSNDLHAELTDSIVKKFLVDNEDFSIQIVIDWVDDLGIRAVVLSDGERSFARSGSPDSVTDALNKLIAKAEPKIVEQREYKAKLEAAFAEDLADDED